MTPEEADAMMRAADAELPGCMVVTAFVLLVTFAGMCAAAWWGLS